MGSVMVSYASARAESMIPKCDVGFLRRAERRVLQQPLSDGGIVRCVGRAEGVDDVGIDWHGHKVTLMCLEAKDHDVWLFAVENAAMPDTPATAPVFARTGKITTASWADGERTYILATEGDEAELKSYL